MKSSDIFMIKASADDIEINRGELALSAHISGRILIFQRKISAVLIL